MALSDPDRIDAPPAEEYPFPNMKARPWQWPVIGLIRVYQWTVSPVLHLLGGPGSGCRYHPTCSEYALEAVRVHGSVRGLRLAARRILRCHPWGGHGHDPVPPRPSRPEVVENRARK